MTNRVKSVEIFWATKVEFMCFSKMVWSQIYGFLWYDYWVNFIISANILVGISAMNMKGALQVGIHRICFIWASIWLASTILKLLSWPIREKLALSHCHIQLKQFLWQQLARPLWSLASIKTEHFSLCLKGLFKGEFYHFTHYLSLWLVKYGAML